MINVDGIPAEVEDLGIALGLLAPSGAGVRLVEEFFADPWTRVGKLVASDVQRAARVRAIEGLLPSARRASRPRRPAGPTGSPGTYRCWSKAARARSTWSSSGPRWRRAGRAAGVLRR
ncbi:hypothetical protein ACGF5C_12110 [Micromonospora sp. NPDC047620]|uniref:hypothetical protein n=1 Tax=Micromonospora sp. NPDC047620 TaxID=3364251 RepID=UPI003711913D